MSQTHYFCPLCFSSNVFQNYPALFKHIRNEHREETFFNIRCELSELCGSRYSSFDSYRCHIYRCHRSLIDSLESDNVISSNIDDVFNNDDDLFTHLDLNDQSGFNEDP